MRIMPTSVISKKLNCKSVYLHIFIYSQCPLLCTLSVLQYLDRPPTKLMEGNVFSHVRLSVSLSHLTITHDVLDLTGPPEARTVGEQCCMVPNIFDIFSPIRTTDITYQKPAVYDEK